MSSKAEEVKSLGKSVWYVVDIIATACVYLLLNVMI